MQNAEIELDKAFDRLESLAARLKTDTERKRLRDEFAKAALASGLCPHNVYEHAASALWAYQRADAMLATREVSS